MNIHDHFGGCAHCVECDGDCELKADDMTATRLIRYLLESHAYTYDGCWFPSHIDEAMAELAGGRKRLEALKSRALACSPRNRKESVTHPPRAGEA